MSARSVACGLTIALACAGCRPRAVSPAGAGGAGEPVRDPFCDDAGPASVHVHRQLLRGWLAPGRWGSFARLEPAQKRELAQLAEQPELALVVEQHGPRVAVTLPSAHPAGPAMLLLASDVDALVVFLPERGLRTSLPRERLPDVIDATTLTSDRTSFELELDPPRPQDEGAEARLKAEAAALSPLPGPRRRAARALGGLRHQPHAARPRTWPLRLALRPIVRDELPPSLPAPANGALHLALPLLEGGDGLELLDRLAERAGTPRELELEVASDAHGAGAGPRLRLAFEDQGWRRVPRAGLCLARAGHRDVRGMPRREGRGRQLLAPALLGRLRATRPAGPLSVANRGAHAALVYLDGALLGWVAADAELAFQGIPEGYYRVYARTPSGARAWGPFEIYVPGPLTLR
jgi:hypothetical protein